MDTHYPLHVPCMAAANSAAAEVNKSLMTDEEIVAMMAPSPPDSPRESGTGVWVGGSKKCDVCDVDDVLCPADAGGLGTHVWPPDIAKDSLLVRQLQRQVDAHWCLTALPTKVDNCVELPHAPSCPGGKSPTALSPRNSGGGDRRAALLARGGVGGTSGRSPALQRGEGGQEKQSSDGQDMMHSYSLMSLILTCT
jgi:hypothetical protein